MRSATLQEIHDLAWQWCSPDACWTDFMDYCTWGCAHEFGHALIAGTRSRSRANYGLCDFYRCCCPQYRCIAVEAAAMMISATLLRRAGAARHVSAERRATYGARAIDKFRPHGMKLMVDRGIWPLPKTASALDRLATRRIGSRNRMPLVCEIESAA